jgi:RNA polymerase sigma factor (sigma-70 family)
MATGQWAIVLRHVQRLFQGESVSGLTEGQLLERFASTRDELAFGAILARHGPMVLGVCRGVLKDPEDVEDAFQATFLVLVKKANALRDSDRLAQWLYGVARRVSLRARSDSIRRKARERPEAEETVDHHATLDADLRELQSLIRDEVDRLSSNDRMAIVLCYLEGLSHEEAADRLGWPVGTVKGRLSRARDKLRERLTRRGVALPTSVQISSLSVAASASVPTALLRSTTMAAIQLASGQSLTAGIVSAQAMTLMEGVISTMFTTKLKIGVAALVATCTVAVPGALAFQRPALLAQFGGQGVATKKSVGPLSAKEAVPKPVDEAVEETSRLSEKALMSLEKEAAGGRARLTLETYYKWSRRLAEAKAGADFPEPARTEALQEHRDRMLKILGMIRQQGEKGQASVDALEAEFRVLEAERWLRNGRIGDLTEGIVPTGPGMGLGGMPLGGGGGFSGGGGIGGRMDPGLRATLTLNQNPADEKRNEAIRAILERPLVMNFPSDTPLGDVMKYIQDGTQDDKAGFSRGLPIYLSPEGLDSADATMDSTVKIVLDGVPLRTTLRLVLRQLGLDYRIDGGIVMIADIDEIVLQDVKARHVESLKK